MWQILFERTLPIFHQFNEVSSYRSVFDIAPFENDELFVRGVFLAQIKDIFLHFFKGRMPSRLPQLPRKWRTDIVSRGWMFWKHHFSLEMFNRNTRKNAHALLPWSMIPRDCMVLHALNSWLWTNRSPRVARVLRVWITWIVLKEQCEPCTHLCHFTLLPEISPDLQPKKMNS